MPLPALKEAPAELARTLPFLKRAEELKDRHPVMSYYCTFHALSLALAAPGHKTPTAEAFITRLFEHLETVRGEA